MKMSAKESATTKKLRELQAAIMRSKRNPAALNILLRRVEHWENCAERWEKRAEEHRRNVSLLRELKQTVNQTLERR